MRPEIADSEIFLAEPGDPGDGAGQKYCEKERQRHGYLWSTVGRLRLGIQRVVGGERKVVAFHDRKARRKFRLTPMQ